MEILMGWVGEKTKPIKLVLSNVEWSQFRDDLMSRMGKIPQFELFFLKCNPKYCRKLGNLLGDISLFFEIIAL